MKLSDKILLGFFSFIFIYLTAAFVEIRVTGTRNILDDKNSAAETVDIPVLSHVVLNDLRIEINITGADRNRLEVRSVSGDLLKGLKYGMSGDTLTLSQAGAAIKEPVRIILFVSKSLKGISVNSSQAVLRNMPHEQLHILENSGHVWITESSIENMELDLSNGSSLDVSGMAMDTLSLTVENSNVSLVSPVGVVRGSLENDSFVRLGEIGDIQLKKDKTSRLSLN